MLKIGKCPSSPIHHLNGDVRAVAFALIAPDTSWFLYDFIHLKGENTHRTDLHTEDTSLAEGFVPDHI